jgi:hypothetical protein
VTHASSIAEQNPNIKRTRLRDSEVEGYASRGIRRSGSARRSRGTGRPALRRSSPDLRSTAVAKRRSRTASDFQSVSHSIRATRSVPRDSKTTTSLRDQSQSSCDHQAPTELRRKTHTLHFRPFSSMKTISESAKRRLATCCRRILCLVGNNLICRVPRRIVGNRALVLKAELVPTDRKYSQLARSLGGGANGRFWGSVVVLPWPATKGGGGALRLAPQPADHNRREVYRRVH